MVYVRYIDDYGPYAYISKREDESVKTVYIGPVSADLANLFTKERVTRENHKESEGVIRDFAALKEEVNREGGKMGIETLLPEIMKEINEMVVQRFGGDSGVLKESVLEFISSQVKATSGVYKKAARLLQGIAQKHPFVDGNKRTAFECASEFLNFHGKNLSVEDTEEAQQFINKVAADQKSFREVEKWLEKRTR